jgi:hypothetical protein
MTKKLNRESDMNFPCREFIVLNNMLTDVHHFEPKRAQRYTQRLPIPENVRSAGEKVNTYSAATIRNVRYSVCDAGQWMLI